MPDASKLTRFKQDFCEYLRDAFERLVDMTEPICAEMDIALADMRVFDTTGIESCAAENNPKFVQVKARQAMACSKLIRLLILILAEPLLCRNVLPAIPP